MSELKVRLSALEKLRLMPPCFTDRTFARVLRMSPPAAQVALHRLKNAELIDTAGERSGVYFNLFLNPNARDEYAIDALLHVYPTAILAGESVLHAAGWITQIPSAISVAVLKRDSYQSMKGFSINGRPIDWFRRFAPLLIKAKDAGFNTYGLRSISPALALADLCVNERFVFDADDLDIPEEERDQIVQSFALLGGIVPDHYKSETPCFA